MHPYEQFPGLVLEIIHQALDTHLYAVDLKRENKLLVLPENPRIIQPNEWKEAIQRYKTHMGYDW